MSLFPNVTRVFLDTIIMRLVPWFLTVADGSLEAARQAALSLLASYNVETEEEIRLAAEITSFSFSALAALSSSLDPDLPINAVIRLRGSANALHRSAHQCQRTLDKLRKERRIAVASADTINQTATTETPPQPRPEIQLSRQQRRAMDRTLEKTRRSQAEQTRRDAMRQDRANGALIIDAAPLSPYDRLAA
jgi:hypothetical protein